MPQYRISDTLLIDTNMILSEEDVAAIADEENAGTFVPERWNVQAVEYIGKVVGETVTIPVTEYVALKECEAECAQQRALLEEMAAARVPATEVPPPTPVEDPAADPTPVVQDPPVAPLSTLDS